MHTFLSLVASGDVVGWDGSCCLRLVCRLVAACARAQHLGVLRFIDGLLRSLALSHHNNGLPVMQMRPTTCDSSRPPLCRPSPRYTIAKRHNLFLIASLQLLSLAYSNSAVNQSQTIPFGSNPKHPSSPTPFRCAIQPCACQCPTPISRVP